jgi:NitT/TauT family transport system permease protein
VGLAPEGVAARPPATPEAVSPPGAAGLPAIRPTGFGRRVLRALPAVALPLAILVSWELVARLGIYRESLLPPPTRVAAVWLDLVAGTTRAAGPYGGSWFGHAAASTWRVFVGFAVAAVLGVGLGLLIGLSPLVEKMVDPTIQLLRNIPVTAWVPLAILFFGIADRPAIALIALGAFFPAVVNTSQGARQVPLILVKAARMMGVDRRQLLLWVVFPAILPSIFTGIRLSMGIAWVLVVVAEMIAVKSGLGYLLLDAYYFFRTDVVIACMLSIGLLGFLSDRLVLAVRHRVLAWTRKETLRG